MRRAVLWQAVLGLALLAAATGCASMANKAPVDQKSAVRKVMDEWKLAMEAKDVDRVMALLSPTAFTSTEFGGYAEFKDSLGEFIGGGRLDNAKVDLGNAQFTVEDGKATVYPVDISAAFGDATLSFQLQLEDKKWLIVSMEQG